LKKNYKFDLNGLKITKKILLLLKKIIDLISKVKLKIFIVIIFSIILIVTVTVTITVTIIITIIKFEKTIIIFIINIIIFIIIRGVILNQSHTQNPSTLP